MNAEDIVVNLIELHDGELVGRTRLQKEAYLLHRCGANFGLAFTYHYYGPYSFELADGLIDAHGEKRIDIKERIGSYGIRYAIFRSMGNAEMPDSLGGLSADAGRSLIEKMQGVSDIILELAATVVYLREEGGYEQNATEETKARKPLKATEDRMEQALVLLSNLGLGIRGQ
jgi:uncharacterized protein YwgA